MAMIEARTPVSKTILSLFLTGMGVFSLIGALGGQPKAWIAVLVFGVAAIYAWRNTLAHQRYLVERAGGGRGRQFFRG